MVIIADIKCFNATGCELNKEVNNVRLPSYGHVP